MKKFYYILCLLLPVLAFVGCTDESFYDNDGEQITLSYKVTLDDEAKSRAIGDGSNVDQLLVGIFQNGEQLAQQEFTVEDNKANITLQLLKNQEYQLVFWAQTKGNGVYNTGDLSNITIDYSNFEKKQVEATKLDAFYATRTVSLENPGTPGVTLTRPFTQFGIGVYGNDVEKDKITSAEIKIKGGLYTAFKPLAEGEKAVYGGDDTEYTFKFTELNDKSNSFVISDKEYTLLTTNYFLVPTAVENPKVSGSLSLKDDSGNSVSDFDFTEAPLVLNARVNIGKGLTEVWDGVYVEALPDADSDGIIHIENTQQLAYLIKYGLKGTADSPAKVHLCKDLDMNATAITRDANYAMQHVSFDGGGNTLYRLGNALLGDAENVEVKDLTIDGMEVTHSGHVGALVNTLKGSSTFTGIVVNNSKVTTTEGAAGGMVGYIVRSSEQKREETLTVTFSNCDLTGVTANGSLSEGKFVGLLSGYDNGETLAFDAECSADANTKVTDYTSPYVTANQSVWAKKDAEGNDITIDSKYNGWLGTETYRRGNVTFEGKRLVPKWDGTTTIEPIYEDANKKIAHIWSPFDLAYLGGKSLTTLRFKTDVDMAGVCNDCKDGNGNSTIANDDLSTCTKCKAFSPIIQLNNLYGENHTLYNLFVQGEHEVGGPYNDGMGFIRHTNSGTFENFTFDGAIIKCIDDFDYRNDDQNGGNGYAGTLTSRVAAKMTITNVHAKNGHVIGISKFGGLIGYVPGGIEATGCSVDNYVIENYKINVTNSYSVSIEKSFIGLKLKAECSENFYTEGEAGGFIGFISSNATITNCQTSNITMKCFGQEDRDTKILTYRQTLAGGWTRTYIDIDYTIAGRHVNTFIGDIRTPSSNTVVINECSTSGNCAEGYDYNITKTGKGELVGCCYFVGKDIEISGKSMHAGDYKGTVTIDGEEMPFVGG